jgi:hypothetical protein
VNSPFSQELLAHGSVNIETEDALQLGVISGVLGLGSKPSPLPHCIQLRCLNRSAWAVVAEWQRRTWFLRLFLRWSCQIEPSNFGLGAFLDDDVALQLLHAVSLPVLQIPKEMKHTHTTAQLGIPPWITTHGYAANTEENRSWWSWPSHLPALN